MKLDVGAFLKSAASIATGQIAGQIDAENLLYQRQQQRTDQQLRQFQIGHQIENETRDDFLRQNQLEMGLASQIAPDERGDFLSRGLTRSSEILGQPSVFGAQALAGIGQPGYQLPNLTGAAPPAPVTGSPAGSYPSSPELGTTKTPFPTFPPGGGGPPVQSPPPGNAPTPAAGSSPLSQTAPPATGAPPTAQVVPGLFGAHIQPSLNTLGQVGSLFPHLGPQAHQYAGALQGQQQQQAQTGIGAAAAAGASGAPGGGLATPARPSPYQQLSPGAASAASALAEPPVVQQQPAPQRLDYAGATGQAPAGGLMLGPPAGEAEPTPPTLKAFGHEYHMSELEKGEGAQIYRSYQQALSALKNANLAGDANAQYWLAQAGPTLIGIPKTRAQLQAMARSTQAIINATAGRSFGAARLTETQLARLQKDIQAPGATPDYYMEIADQIERVGGGNAPNILTGQPEWQEMKRAAVAGDTETAQRIASLFQARFSTHWQNPAQEGRQFLQFLTSVGKMPLQVLARKDPKTGHTVIRSLIDNAGLAKYFAGIPEDQVLGVAAGSGAEELTRYYLKHLSAEARLPKEAQHAYVNQVIGAYKLMGEKGPPVDLPADMVLQMSDGERQRLALGVGNMKLHGRTVAVQEARLKLLQGKLSQFGAHGLTPNQQIVTLQGLWREDERRLQAFIAGQPDKETGASLRVDLDRWKTAHPGQAPYPVNGAADEKNGIASESKDLRGLWILDRDAANSRKKLEDGLHALVGGASNALGIDTAAPSGPAPAGKPAGRPVQGAKAAAPVSDIWVATKGKLKGQTFSRSKVVAAMKAQHKTDAQINAFIQREWGAQPSGSR